MRSLLRCLLVPALLLPAVSQAYGQGAVAAAAIAGRGVRMSPMPLTTVTPGTLKPFSVLSAPTLTPGLQSGLPSPTLLPSLKSAPRVQALGHAPVLPAALPAVTPRRAAAAAPMGGKTLISPEKAKSQFAVRTQAVRAGEDLGKVRKQKGSEKAHAGMKRVFDGAKAKAVNAVAAPQDFRPPDWAEDRRINRALARLGESEIGLDIYRYVYDNHKELRIMIDDDRRADYDSRLIHTARETTLYLTEKLVDEESAEVVAAFMAREMSDLYFASFPNSVERRYMAASNMVRTFAELTESGLAKWGYWWDKGRDQRSGDAYTMQRYYGSWKEAVKEGRYYGRRGVQDSPFFGWLKSNNDDEKSHYGKDTVEERYYNGSISYEEAYRSLNYFDSYLSSERNWVDNTGRR